MVPDQYEMKLIILMMLVLNVKAEAQNKRQAFCISPTGPLT